MYYYYKLVIKNSFQTIHWFDLILCKHFFKFGIIEHFQVKAITNQITDVPLSVKVKNHPQYGRNAPKQFTC